MTAFSKILNAGTYPGIGDREQIAITTANVTVILLLVLGLLWAAITAYQGLFIVASINFTVAFAALMLHVGMHVANVRFLKVGIILLATFYFVMLNLLLGWRSGIEFYGAPILMVCLLLFPDRKQAMSWIMLALIMALVIGTYVSMLVYEPLLAVPEHDKLKGYSLTVFLVLPVTLLLMFVFQRQSRQVVERLHEDRDKAIEIVSSVLPEMITQRLQQGHKMIADSHGGATVLFADIVGFTKLTSRFAPSQLVESLNELFTQVDRSAAQLGVEKIKTIGDCYMAACGVLHEIDDPANMIEFAKNLRSIVRDYGETLGYPLDVRIGIGYGQVISGVIGREKKTFDLWGETVNLASRMESTGTSGRIQVTESLYWRLRSVYQFEKREDTMVKGLGLMTTYFLEEPVPQ